MESLSSKTNVTKLARNEKSSISSIIASKSPVKLKSTSKCFPRSKSSVNVIILKCTLVCKQEYGRGLYEEVISQIKEKRSIRRIDDVDESDH